jgi:hypothetical protein
MPRFATTIALLATIVVVPAFARSDEAGGTDALFAALGMPEIIDIMREEGVEYGTSVAADLLPSGVSPDWANAVQMIYDPQMMYDDVRSAFGEALEGDDIDAMLAFFSTDTGTEIISLELSARRAMLNDAVEEASIEAAALQKIDKTPRYLMVQSFVDANDLIESNVVGSLNSSYAFYTGLIDGGALPVDVTRDTALQDVWRQEPEIRDSTTEWIYAFLLMAYQPLTDDQLETYIAFSETEAGQNLTSAMFASFDGMFEDISRALGLGVSRFMMTREL